MIAKKQTWSGNRLNLSSCIGKGGFFLFLFPLPLSWGRCRDIVNKIEGKNINYMSIILNLEKRVYFNLKQIKKN